MQNAPVEKTTEEEKKPEKKKSTLLSWVLYFAAVLVMTFLIIRFVGVRTQVSGTSMSPSLSAGDNLIVEKVSYYFSDPRRYDIIVFPYPGLPSKHYIKRIIGLPGETVQIIDGQVYIDGQLLGETYGNAPMDSAGIAGDPVVLGEDEYFVLGDNRNNSEDSRYTTVGNIHRKDISGKAWVRIWPLNKFGILKHQ